MAQQHKTCTKCGETKPLDGFNKKKSGKYGAQSRCKPCIAEQKRRYREENREKMAERDRRYHEANREDIAEQKRRYNELNRESINEKMKRNSKERQELSKKFVTVPPHTPYLPGEDALIIADDGMTIYQKAIELGRTYDSVSGRRRRLLAKGGVSNDRANA